MNVTNNPAQHLSTAQAHASVATTRRQSGATSGRWFLPWAFVTLALLIFGLYQALIAAPTEETMGTIQRIFYYHVPAALTAFAAFFTNFIASVVYLFRRSKASDALAVASAEVGLVFLTINLITGPIWAKPVWGIWWTWDARLTLTLVMWLMYVSYLILRQFTRETELQPRLAAALSVFIFADVPIDYMAIRWWRTQHPQPVMLGGSGSGLDPRMTFAFLICWAAFLLLAAGLIYFRYTQEFDRLRIATLRRDLLLRPNTRRST